MSINDEKIRQPNLILGQSHWKRYHGGTFSVGSPLVEPVISEKGVKRQLLECNTLHVTEITSLTDIMRLNGVSIG